MEPLFEKVGMVHRARARAGSGGGVLPLEPAKPTHVVCVVHPSDESECWRLAISVLDDEQAKDRMRQLRGWADWDSRLFLYRADDLTTSLCYMMGTREN